jgi:hypothetical protein
MDEQEYSAADGLDAQHHPAAAQTALTHVDFVAPLHGITPPASLSPRGGVARQNIKVRGY